jgi:YD repeat-containing protein
VPGGLVVLLVAYLLLWPAPIEPVAVEPPPALTDSAALAQNELLREAERLSTSTADGDAGGPETVAVDAAGNLFAGLEDGRILRMNATGGDLQTFADTGGRPLGLAWDGRGQLLVADADKGLLSIDPQGVVITLATEADGVPFRFTDDVDVAADGRIYFSDASSRFGYGDHVLDLLEGRASGRLLRYDPESRRVEVLLDDLRFANGVALAADDSFVLVNETGRLCTTRLWLSGPQAGERDVFAESFPGYPDGISRGSDGRFWVAIFAPRNPSADKLGPKPFLKKIVSRLPRMLWPAPERYGLVLALDQQGRVVASLHDPGGEWLHAVTSAEEHDGLLYLGTLHEPHLARLSLDLTR